MLFRSERCLAGNAKRDKKIEQVKDGIWAGYKEIATASEQPFCFPMLFTALACGHRGPSLARAITKALREEGRQ